MAATIRKMGKRYNQWREKPLTVRLATSARAVLMGAKNARRQGTSCSDTGACGGGSECEVQTCASCQVEGDG